MYIISFIRNLDGAEKTFTLLKEMNVDLRLVLGSKYRPSKPQKKEKNIKILHYFFYSLK